MIFKRVSLLAGGVCLLASSTFAQTTAPTQDFLGLLQRISGHYTILIARSLVDLTYDQITVEPGSNALVISGLTIFPELPWDQDFACEITVERAVLGSIYGFDTSTSTIEITGVKAPAVCFTPDVGGMLQGFGYSDGITADTMSIEIAYDLPSSAADVSIQAALKDAADVSISAGFNYLWFRFPTDGGDEPIPVVVLGEAEIAVENGGLWERVEPMLAAQMGDINAIPGMAQLTIGQMMAGPDGQTPPAAQAFAENLSTELARFIEEKNRIVVSVAPEEGLFLDDNTFGSPAEVVELLQPTVSGVPAAYRALIGPDELAAALSGGAGLADDARLRVGEALLTGIGAPRSLADGKALLMPLADAWNAKAASLLAKAMKDSGDAAEAYAMALRAQAGDAPGAVGLADQLETSLGVDEILAAQAAAVGGWDGVSASTADMTALLEAGDISGLRRFAFAASIGKGMPRNYGQAYYLASLAAAGGDRGAANLRRRLDERFAARDAAAWRAEADAAAQAAVQTWTSKLGAIIAGRVK